MSEYQHIVTLTLFSKAKETSSETVRVVVAQWVDSFERALKDGTEADIASLFHDDAWIRDYLAFSWDFRTIRSSTKVVNYIKQNQDTVQLGKIRPRSQGAFQPVFKSPTSDLHWVEYMFEFETAFGKGRGMLRLVVADDNIWKGYLIILPSKNSRVLRRHQDRGARTATSTHDMEFGVSEGRGRRNSFKRIRWYLSLVLATLALISQFAYDTPAFRTLIIDRNERVGDNWHKRYRVSSLRALLLFLQERTLTYPALWTLTTHGPVQYCHMPFMPFPSDWPLYIPKDKLADWLESYANVMELNVWTSTTLQKTEFDEKTKTWTVAVRRGDGSVRTLKSHHVVLATGQAGDPIMHSFPGQDLFKGQISHGCDHYDASLVDNLSRKRVVVVGSGNSSHDICQDYYESGAAEVTMLQRGDTYIFSLEKGVPLMYKGMYDEHGPPTEDADLYAQSLPIPIQLYLNAFGTQRIADADRELLDGLSKAGFRLDSGPDKSGILRKYLTRGGGYYIDVGCSQLIIDGKVKLHHSPAGIKSFDENGLVLVDGSKLEADIVVLATGYDGMISTARKLFGDKVGDRLGDVWDLDEEGEVRAMWRNSGHPTFWFMGGNLAICRSNSRLLALQIKAMEVGLLKQT